MAGATDAQFAALSGNGELVPATTPGGEHTWKIKWVPIGVQP
jgi:hypothetical protein